MIPVEISKNEYIVYVKQRYQSPCPQEELQGCLMEALHSFKGIHFQIHQNLFYLYFLQLTKIQAHEFLKILCLSSQLQETGMPASGFCAIGKVSLHWSGLLEENAKRSENSIELLWNFLELFQTIKISSRENALNDVLALFYVKDDPLLDR